MSKVPNAQLVHIGLHCRDLEKMVDYGFRRLLHGRSNHISEP